MNLEHFWLPFTSNNNFKRLSKPRIINRAEGMYYYTIHGDKILDAHGGLWCCNAGHNRKEIVEAIQKQASELDFVPSYQMSHPGTFLLSNKLVNLLSNNLKYAFFTNSGSEAVETALKISLAYWELLGRKNKKIIIGRDRAFHGTSFGGMSVGNLMTTKQQFNRFLPDVVHLSHTHNLEKNAFSKGQPLNGLELADELTEIINKHGSENIAAVILEPISGTGGVLIPPIGYLERIKKICTENDILLIFDEVITGFGRLGKPFAIDYFGIEPDLLCLAKGLTSGTSPMGATMIHKSIYDLFMDLNGVELWHGYTYSGHPLSCAAALATLEVYEKENLLNINKEILDYWEQGLHSLKGTKHIVDIRNIGLLGAIELEQTEKNPIRRAVETFEKMFHEENCYVRLTGGNILTMAPPLIINKEEIDKIVSSLETVLNSID